MLNIYFGCNALYSFWLWLNISITPSYYMPSGRVWIS